MIRRAKNALSGTFQEFTTATINIPNNGRTNTVRSQCADILFTNETPLSVVTNGNIIVNSKVLLPGEFIGYLANNDELNTDEYTIVFETAATNLSVSKRLYTGIS